MYSGDLQDQMSLVTLGNPFAGRIPIPGNQKASALIPHLDHVLFDANLDTSWAATDYLSPDYFFMPYSLHQEQVAPHGFSQDEVYRALTFLCGAIQLLVRDDLTLACRIAGNMKTYRSIRH